MSPRHLLRLEGLIFFASTGAYTLLECSWRLFGAMLLAPDVFMAGSLFGARVGAHICNAGHTYTAPVLLGGVAYLWSASLLGALFLIWVAHIGMDRALGDGLKRPTGFHDTHLSSPSSIPA